MKLRPYILVAIICSCTSKQRISRYDANKSEIFTYQSRYFLDKNEFDSAEICLSKALKLDPENYAAFNNRAILKFKRNMPHNDVIADFNKSIELNPHYDVALASLANYYFEIKDYVNTVEACNNFISQAAKSEVSKTQIEHIYAIKADAQKYTRIVEGIAVFRAMAYYDSISVVVTENLGGQQDLIDKVAAVANDNTKYKGLTTYLDLGRLLDSASLLSQRTIDDLNKLTEVDFKINYKQKVLNHAKLLNSVFENEFKQYLHRKEYMGVLGINKLRRISIPIFRQIKNAQLKMLKAREQFKSKYGFTTPEAGRSNHE